MDLPVILCLIMMIIMLVFFGIIMVSMNKNKNNSNDNSDKIAKDRQESSDKQNKERFESYEKIQFERLEVLRLQLEKQERDSRESLDSIKKVVGENLHDEFDKRFANSFKPINEQLERLQNNLGEIKNISGDVISLRNVLSNVKTRGIWGEVQLGSMLEEMMHHTQFAKNVSIGKSSLYVDFVVKMPGTDDKGVYLPIDSKFPLDKYQKLVDSIDSGNKDEVDGHAKELRNSVKEQAKSIAEKYINPPQTTDFAILYLPLESLYSEVAKQPGLITDLQNKYKIVICGPTTLCALLNSLRLGFTTVAMEKKSKELWKLLSAFKMQFLKFDEKLEKADKKIEEASKIINEIKKETNKVSKKLGSVENISDSEKEKLLDEDTN